MLASLPQVGGEPAKGRLGRFMCVTVRQHSPVQIQVGCSATSSYVVAGGWAALGGSPWAPQDHTGRPEGRVVKQTAGVDFPALTLLPGMS